MKKLLSSLALAMTALPGATAVAQAPALIPIQGFVTDNDGTPRDGDATFDLAIYTSATGDAAIHQESQVVDIDSGYFSTEIGLGDELDLSLFATQPELWVDIVIDGDPLEPRLALGTVPYAAYAEFAGEAETLGGLTAEQLTFTDWDTITNIPAELADGDDVGSVAVGAGLTDASGSVEVDFGTTQARVTGTCGPEAAIAAINADGTVTCETDDSGGTYVGGLGITISDVAISVDTTAIQSRVVGACGLGQVMSSINADGTVNCGVDVDSDTTYSAGSGLQLSGTTFSIDPTQVQAPIASSCPAGQAIRAINTDGSVECELDDDTNTTYTASNGVTLFGSDFRADTSVVQSRVAGSCSAGQAIRAISAAGTVTCEPVGGSGADSWGGPVRIPFMPTSVTGTCGSGTLGGNVFGSTASTTQQWIGTMFYSENDDDRAIRHDYTRARLQALCRGNGRIELYASCSPSASPIATIACSSGSRPWVGTSEEFDPGASGSWNISVVATSGTIEWSQPAVLLY